MFAVWPRSRRPALAVLGVLALLAAAASEAEAHQTSVTHLELELNDAAGTVATRVLVSPLDLGEALGKDKATPLTDADLVANTTQIIALITQRVAVKNDQRPCPPAAAQVRVSPSAPSYFEVSWQSICPQSLGVVSLDYDLFFDIDPLHAAMLVARRGDNETASTILKADAARFVWDPQTELPSGVWAFVSSGIDHILYGFDHIAFVLALLFVLVLRQKSDDGEVEQQEVWGSVKRTAAVVSAFTVAHSLTLIAAALGWVSLPSRLVESVIALSIVYVAIENIIRPVPRWRYAVVFGFGLVHGLGFARMLEVLLPPEGIIVPLLAFNVGVELGQLAIVVTVLPLLHLVARSVGASRYRQLVLPILSGTLAMLGATWFIERVANVTLLGL